MGRTKQWGHPLGSPEAVVEGFLTSSHPHAIIIPNNNFESDQYLFIHELIEGDQYSGMALTRGGSLDWVIYCANQIAVDNLNDVLHELRVDFYNFIPQKRT